MKDINYIKTFLAVMLEIVTIPSRNSSFKSYLCKRG